MPFSLPQITPRAFNISKARSVWGSLFKSAKISFLVKGSSKQARISATPTTQASNRSSTRVIEELVAARAANLDISAGTGCTKSGR